MHRTGNRCRQSIAVPGNGFLVTFSHLTRTISASGRLQTLLPLLVLGLIYAFRQGLSVGSFDPQGFVFVEDLSCFLRMTGYKRLECFSHYFASRLCDRLIEFLQLFPCGLVVKLLALAIGFFNLCASAGLVLLFFGSVVISLLALFCIFVIAAEIPPPRLYPG